MNIQDIINEVNSIQSKKEAIKEAITAKGVTSEGKLSKFAEEIKSITAAAPINENILTAVNNAINLGLEEKQVAAAINNYVAAYAEIDLTSTDIPNNKYRNNTTIKPIHVYFRAVSIGAYAFSRSNLKKLTAPLVKKIMQGAFDYCGDLEELNLGSYDYKAGNTFTLVGCSNMKKLVVGDNSVITPGDYNGKITINNKNIEIYTYSGKKYNKNNYRFE